MTYIIKTMNDGKVGIYDTLKACFPLAGKELREAGVTRIDGTDGDGWFKKADRETAENIATMLNLFHGHSEDEPQKAPSKGRKAKQDDDEAAFKALAESIA